MITDEQLANLPDNIELAFTQFEALCRQAMESQRNNTWSAERRYVAYTLAFIKEHNINFPDMGVIPRNDNDFPTFFSAYISEVDFCCTRIRIRNYKNLSIEPSSVSIHKDFKEEIHKHIQTIRKIVIISDLDDEKQDSILAKLNALASEVDRSRTRLEALTVIWLDLTRAIGEGVENLAPALDRLERIAGIFGGARDGEALPAPNEQKQLPAPEPTNDE